MRWTIAGSGPVVAGTYIGLKDFVERASVPLANLPPAEVFSIRRSAVELPKRAI